MIVLLVDFAVVMFVVVRCYDCFVVICLLFLVWWAGWFCLLRLVAVALVL